MLKHLLAAAIAATMIAAPAATAAYAQTATEKSEAKKPKKAAKKELTPQQQKMKDCAAKWGDHKKEKKVKGRTEYNKFMSGCLKA